MAPSLEACGRRAAPRELPPSPLSGEEVRALLEACGLGRGGLRARAHLALLYRTGLRVAESCSLRAADLSLEPGKETVTVLWPKGVARGAPKRILGLDWGVLAELRPWLRLRDREAARGSLAPWLFTTRRGLRIHPSQLRQTIRMLALRAGLNRRVHPHALRHTFARELYFEGAGLAEIMGALGHQRLATTQLYLRSIGATEVVALTRAREWK